MLLLTRAPHENIMIVLPDGREIKIRILERASKNSKQIGIGIEADKDIIVDREEIYLRKKEDLKNKISPIIKTRRAKVVKRCITV